MKSNLPPTYKKLAFEVARDSIVTKALARLLEQVIEEVSVASNADRDDMRERNAKLVAALRKAEWSLLEGGASQDVARNIHAALSENDT